MGAELSFGWEPIAALMGEPNFRDLILAQWEELSGVKEIPLDPDFERMAQMEAAGCFKIWAARADGLLVGWVDFHIAPPLHHRSTLYAMDCGHYLTPEFRDTWTHLKIWRSACAALQDMGVKVIMAHDNPMSPMGAFFKRLGFDPGGSIYVKKVL